MSPKPVLHDPALGPLTDDALTRDVRVYQRSKGHRFSADDIVTAWVACQHRPDARRVLDLGCGLGSVLLTVAWRLPHATLVGVEAQAMSFELVKRNVERNGLGERVQVRHGDLRDERSFSDLAPGFDLVTGTPPYFPPETALDAMDEQRAYARIEYRGGVEAYLERGAAMLARDGVMVLCGDARADGRVSVSATSLGLQIIDCCEIVAREGKPALFSVWTLRFDGQPRSHRRLTLRDSQGNTTADAAMLRAFCGFPPRS